MSFKNVFSQLTEKYGIRDNHDENRGNESEANMPEECNVVNVNVVNENEHIIEETNMEFSDAIVITTITKLKGPIFKTCDVNILRTGKDF